MTIHKTNTAEKNDVRQRLADPSERIDFACRQCGGCCTNTTPYVTPLDVWRLARSLGTSTSDIISKHLIIIETNLPGVDNMGRVPLLALQMSSRSHSTSRQCTFLNGKAHLCTVYDARPLSCRMFPAGLQHLTGWDGSGNGDSKGDCQGKNYQYVLVQPLPECTGYGAGYNTVQQYLAGEVHDDDLDCWRQYTDLMVRVFQGNDLAGNEDFADSFLAAIFDLDSRDGADFCGCFEQGRKLIKSWLA